MKSYLTKLHLPFFHPPPSATASRSAGLLLFYLGFLKNYGLDLRLTPRQYPHLVDVYRNQRSSSV